MQIRKRTTQYTLMNKDTAVLSFLCNRNEFDEPEFVELVWHVPYRPIGYKTLVGFLERRKAPKHRQHIQRLVFSMGSRRSRRCLPILRSLAAEMRSAECTFWTRLF